MTKTLFSFVFFLLSAPAFAQQNAAVLRGGGEEGLFLDMHRSGIGSINEYEEKKKFFDMVIVVDAPLEVRMERIKKRNPNLTEEEITARINAQMPQEEKCRRADMVIDNRG